MTEKLIVPIVHLNGTSADRLEDVRHTVIDRIHDLGKAIAEMAPNGRDYYVEPGLMDKAHAQHERRLSMLRGLVAEIESEIENICEQKGNR